MAILSCHVSIKLPPKISDGQQFSSVDDCPLKRPSKADYLRTPDGLASARGILSCGHTHGAWKSPVHASHRGHPDRRRSAHLERIDFLEDGAARGTQVKFEFQSLLRQGRLLKTGVGPSRLYR